MIDRHIVATIKPLSDKPLIYRLYVDDDLITERTFIWGDKMCVSENIFVNLENGIHSIVAETIITDPMFGVFENFKITDLSVDGVPIRMNTIESIRNLFILE